MSALPTFFPRTVTILASPTVVKTPNESKMAHNVENSNYQSVIKPSRYKQKPPDNPNIPRKRLTTHTQVTPKALIVRFCISERGGAWGIITVVNEVNKVTRRKCIAHYSQSADLRQVGNDLGNC